MFKKALITILAIITTHTSIGQVALTLETNRKNYHQYEAAHIQLTLRNFSGTPLIFGNAAGLSGSVTLEIKQPGNTTSNQSEYIEVNLENLILRPGIAEKTQINLSKYFTLRRIGKYRIKAIVKHEQLGSEYESNLVHINASEGFFVWSSTAGIPDVLNENTDNKIKSVNYKIDSLFDGKDRVYYLIIEDKQRIYTVARIGQDTGTSAPQCQIDYLSRLHVMIQDSAKIFTHYIYETSGERVSRVIYKKTTTSPRLTTDPNTGKIVVIGGSIAKEGADYQ